MQYRILNTFRTLSTKYLRVQDSAPRGPELPPFLVIYPSINSLERPDPVVPVPLLEATLGEAVLRMPGAPDPAPLLLGTTGSPPDMIE
jgi:hypothetical protein